MKMPRFFLSENASEVLFRVLFSLIFLVAGMQHIVGLEQVLLRFWSTPWAPLLNSIIPAAVLVLMTGIALLVGGLGLLSGSLTRLAAVLLFSVLIPITLTVQLQGKESLGPLFKNIALMGGLIHFASRGAGYWSLDRLRSQGRKSPLYFFGAKSLAALLLAAFMIPTALQLPTMAEAKTETLKKVDKLAMLVREPQHLQVALKTAKEGMQGKDGIKLTSVNIVVCGKNGVTGLKKGNSMEAQITDASSHGINVLACGLSLKEADMKPEELSSKVAVVENGLWEMIRLQSEGALSIEL